MLPWQETAAGGHLSGGSIVPLLYRHGVPCLAVIGLAAMLIGLETMRPKELSMIEQLPLSDEQRGFIFESVMQIVDAPVARAPAPEAADPLSDSVAMQDLPAGVIQDIPLVQDHKFVKFEDRIVVIEPTSRAVVAMIPRYRLLP
jgi:hypothetical protein